VKLSLVSLALLLIAAVAPVAGADALATHFGWIDDGIAQHKAILTEIARRAEERAVQLEKWVEYWIGIRNLTREMFTSLEQDFDARIKGAEKALGTLQSVVTKPEEERHLPQYGWQSTVTMAKAIKDLKDEWAKAKALYQKGKKEWHIAGLGWQSGEAIEAKIKALQEEIKATRQGVTDGTYEIHYAGVGWVNGRHARGRIEQAEKEKQSLRELVAKGEYEVVIPGLGPRTRNRLDAEIRQQEEAIAGLRTTAAKGELSIHRAAIGWNNRHQLQAALDEGAKSYAAMEKLVGDGLFNVWIDSHGAGWMTLKDLRDRIAGMDKALAEANKATASGTYNANVYGGWATKNAIEEGIKNAGKELANANLTPEQRKGIAARVEKLRKALTDWQHLSAFDVAIKGLERTRTAAWLALPLKLAKPDFDYRKLVRAERTTHLSADFERDLTMALQPYELRLARLREARKLIPGG
jgi:hypothetical protein